MSVMSAVSTSSRALVKPVVAVGGVIFLWAGYTVLQTLFVMGVVSEGWSAFLGFVPGILGLGVLWAAGLSRKECFLVFRPLSWQGLGVLAGVFVFALGAILPFSVWQGWNWQAALVYAPASGISQELFFRATLLPAMGMAVMLVPFLSGIGWGWQVQRDRTVVWAMVQHSLIWVIGNQFAVPS